MSDDHTKDFILNVCSHLKAEDYAFTIDALGTAWDVYHFMTPAKQRGMVAFRVKDGQFEIGFFRKGQFEADEIRRQLSDTAPS